MCFIIIYCVLITLPHNVNGGVFCMSITTRRNNVLNNTCYFSFLIFFSFNERKTQNRYFWRVLWIKLYKSTVLERSTKTFCVYKTSYIEEIVGFCLKCIIFQFATKTYGGQGGFWNQWGRWNKSYSEGVLGKQVHNQYFSGREGLLK